MTSFSGRPSLEKRHSDKKSRTPDEEVKAFDTIGTVSVVDSVNDDEALKLVGKERSAEFSEEYYRKLRRKLVRSSSFK